MQRVFFAQVEIVAILHVELAAPHHAETRADLVAEFPLDLIHGQRQILVRRHMGPEDVGDQFLGGRCEQHVTAMAVFDPQHFFAVIVIATAFAPQVGRLDGWHLHRDVASTHLFFVDDVFDLAQHLEAERQPGIDPGGRLLDHPGTQHQPVADDLGLGRVFLEDRQEIAGQAHGNSGVLAALSPEGLGACAHLHKAD